MFPKLLVILGPTASGKSALAVRLAKKFNGEVVSADSRQVYKGLDIGTGKITHREMRGIPHHLLDVANPKKQFSVAEYKKLADEAVSQIHRKNHLPILTGGTGFYIQAVTDDIVLPDVPPDKALRRKLTGKTPGELFMLLKKLDLNRSKHIDPKNSRRLVRAIEVASTLGRVPELKEQSAKANILQIGIMPTDTVLKENIAKRVRERMKRGMVTEAQRLHAKGLSWKRMAEIGLDYKLLASYGQGQMTKDELTEKLIRAEWQYAKRQKTWFKRDKRIKWFRPGDSAKIEHEVKKFLKR